MNRRRLLRTAAGACALSLVGCLGDGADTPADATGTDDSPDDEQMGTPTSTGTETPTPTPTATPTDTATPARVASRSFEVTDSGCGQQRDEATVSFDEGGERVSVTGTIWGNDLGYTAVLDAVQYADGTLTVTVAARREQTTGTVAAGQCIAEINYAARVTVEGAPPATVVVRHRHGSEVTTVATAER